MPSELAIVGVKRGHDPRPMQGRAIVSDRIECLDLERPPVGERGGHRSMPQHRVDDFVALGGVMQTADANIEILQHARNARISSWRYAWQ